MRSPNYERIRHRAVIFESFNHLRHGRPLLADRDVDADHVLAFWLMMVSSAIAVLPVWRSPMISSRCPRPIGIMPSMALIPVWTGCLTTSGR